MAETDVEPELIRVLKGLILRSSPGATPGGQVGTVEWMQTLYPPSDDRYTITFGPDKENAVSFTEDFLTEHFDYFKGCLSNATVECSEKATNLAETAGDAFALIIAFLVVGVFPKAPWRGPRGSKMITDRLDAAVLADYLGLKSVDNLVLILQTDVRQIITADRESLRMKHIETVLSQEVPESFVRFADIFAAAAVKPILLGWMKDAKRETIESSIAGQSLQETPYHFKRIIAHYETLLAHEDYQLEVFKEVQVVIQSSKRLNKLAINDAAVNKKLKQIPDQVDHVTYCDPLPIPLSEGRLFTV